MAEDILNRETALQRRHDRMRKRQSAALSRRIALLLGFLFIILTLLVTASVWVLASYTTPLTLPESVGIRRLIVSDQETVEASDFVAGLKDTGISVAFDENYSDRYLGEQEVTLVFTRGHEVCTRVAKLYRFHIETSLQIQLGQETDVNARSFVPDENVDATLITSLEEGACGTFLLALRCEGKDYKVECKVTENIPPRGITKELTVEAGTLPEPADFFEELIDHSPVTVTYKTPQEFVLVGTQQVKLVLTDYFGNVSEVEATANVIPAANGPQFTGLDTLHIEVGFTVSYKNGVKAMDAQDGELPFTVDIGDLDTKTIGQYAVYYSAVDSDGHRITVLRTVIVESHVAQLLREKVQSVLSEIIRPGMTRDEQIRAVCEHVRWNMAYVSKSDKSSIENAAYEGFTKYSGDCYTYYAMVRVMLDALGIPNLECRRVGGTSNHWWNLVQFEDGKYYHIDVIPHAITWMAIHFKMTETTIRTYTENPDVAAHKPNYYTYDHSLPEYQNIEIAQ